MRILPPVGRGYTDGLRQYVRGFLRGDAPSYLGHHPLGRLMLLIPLHIAGVVITEIRETSGLVSAMISGEKMLAEFPKDETESRSGDKEYMTELCFFRWRCDRVRPPEAAYREARVFFWRDHTAHHPIVKVFLQTQWYSGGVRR